MLGKTVVSIGSPQVQRADTVMRFGSYFSVIGLSRIPHISSVGWHTPVNSYVAVGHIVAVAAMLFGRVRCNGIRMLGDRLRIRKYRRSPEELVRKLARDLDLVITSDCSVRGAISVRREREWLEDMYRFAIVNRTEDALLNSVLWLSSNYGVQLSKAVLEVPNELVSSWRRSGISIRRSVNEALERYRNNLFLLLSNDAGIASIYEGYVFGPRFPRDLASTVVRDVSMMSEIGELLDRVRSRGLVVLTSDEYSRSSGIIELLEHTDVILVVTDDELGLVYLVDKALALSVASLIFGKSDVDELSRDKRAPLYLLIRSVARSRFARDVLGISEDEARRVAFEYIAHATGKSVNEVERDLSQLIDLVSGGEVISRFSISVAGRLAVESIRKKIVDALRKRQPRITDFM